MIVYTAIAGDYDELAPAPVRDGVRCIAFVEDDVPANGWELRALFSVDDDPVRRAKRYKVLPMSVLPDTRFSLWLDASIVCSPHLDLLSLPTTFLRDADIATLKHPVRNCIYVEADEVLRLRLDAPTIVLEQMKRYRAAQYPAFNGLAETGVMLRRHTNYVQRQSDEWWNEIRRGSRRDQLSFNYTCREYNTFSTEVRSAFYVRNHAKPRATVPP